MTRPLTVALLVGFLIAGCAQQQQPSEAPVSPSSSPTPAFQPSTSPAKSSSGQITVTGTVEHLEIEGGCTVLRDDSTNKAYELMGGDRQVLKVGNHVRVVGRIRTDIVTICQAGPVLEVVSSQVA